MRGRESSGFDGTRAKVLGDIVQAAGRAILGGAEKLKKVHIRVMKGLGGSRVRSKSRRLGTVKSGIRWRPTTFF